MNYRRYTEYKTYTQCPYLHSKRFIEGKDMPGNRNMAIGRAIEEQVNMSFSAIVHEMTEAVVLG